MSTEEDKRLLVLHFDVNETILIGDEAGGDSFDDTLNKALAKAALVDSAAQARGELRLHDNALGAAWDLPDGAASFYRSPLVTRAQKQRFAEHFDGFADELARMRACLALPANADPRLSHDGKHSFVVPAFWRVLEHLLARGRPFRIVVRTFGTDAPDVIAALHAWRDTTLAAAQQAQVALPRDSDDWWLGRYIRADDAEDEDDDNFVFSLRHRSWPEHKALVDEARVVATLEREDSPELCCVVVVQDDYHHWANHDYSPSAGKPLFLHDKHTHVFFDDNIHRDADDSIVAARKAVNNKRFKPLSGAETIELHGTHTFKVFTRDAILNEQYFIELLKDHLLD